MDKGLLPFILFIHEATSPPYRVDGSGIRAVLCQRRVAGLLVKYEGVNPAIITAAAGSKQIDLRPNTSTYTYIYTFSKSQSSAPQLALGMAPLTQL